jgi:hypothetical protein
VLPLHDAKIVKRDVLKFWQDQPFDLRLDPESYQGNCDFCFLKNDTRLINLMRERLRETGGVVPPDIQWWIDKEVQAGMFFRQTRSYAGLVQIAQSATLFEPSLDASIDCMCGAADD